MLRMSSHESTPSSHEEFLRRRTKQITQAFSDLCFSPFVIDSFSGIQGRIVSRNSASLRDPNLSSISFSLGNNKTEEALDIDYLFHPDPGTEKLDIPYPLISIFPVYSEDAMMPTSEGLLPILVTDNTEQVFTVAPKYFLSVQGEALKVVYFDYAGTAEMWGETLTTEKVLYQHTEKQDLSGSDYSYLESILDKIRRGKFEGSEHAWKFLDDNA